MFVVFPTGYISNSTNGSLEVDMTYAVEFDIMQFMLKAFKDERSATLIQFVEITQGAPPKIDPRICVDNCGVSDLVSSNYFLSINYVTTRLFSNTVLY